MNFNIDNLNYTALSFQLANKNSTSICQIALLSVENGKNIYQKTFLLKPPTKNFSFSNYHGITLESVKNAPTLEIVWQEISKYINEHIVIVYDIYKTAKRLNESLKKYNIEAPSCQYIDIRSLFPNNMEHQSYEDLANAVDYWSCDLNGNSAEIVSFYNFVIEKRVEENSRLLKKAFNDAINNSDLNEKSIKKQTNTINEIQASPETLKAAKQLADEILPFVQNVGRDNLPTILSHHNEGEHIASISTGLYKKDKCFWAFTDKRMYMVVPSKSLYKEWEYTQLLSLKTDMGFIMNTLYFKFKNEEVRTDISDFKIIYPRLKKYINPDIITEDKKTKKFMSSIIDTK